MADFKNHRRFSLRCLDNNIIPVSLKLRSNIKTPKAKKIIKKTERALLNERIIMINNTIELCKHEKDTCIEELSKVMGQEDMEECNRFMFNIKEERHLKTMARQKRKLERLQGKNEVKTGGHTNNQRYMYRQSGTENSSTTSSITNLELDSRPTASTSATGNLRDRWVMNLSKIPLTEAQENLLAHGPNYAITPRSPPIGEYTAAVEQTCQNLAQGEAGELRAEVKAVFKKCQPPRNNITKEEQKALSELKKDTSRVILTADKGTCLVVMDREEYINKAKDLLKEDTYKIIAEDPTNKQKNKLIQLLKKIKAEGGINEECYRKMYPTGGGTSKFYGLPKVHKAGVPLRPIVSSRGSVSYNTSKELARILKPMAGRSTFSVQNTMDFVEQVKNIKLQPQECIVSYDVKALFTSVPTKSAVNIIKQLLEDDKELQQRTTMTVQNIICLLEFCLNNTNFIFQGNYYEQTEGAAMGSPLSPIIANIYMEAFEKQAISTAPHPPIFWRRFVDDTFVVIQKTKEDSFFNHLNTIDERIQFTREESRSDGSMPFLDTLVTINEDGSLSTKVYRKKTHTDLYLQWDSHHSIAAKYSVINTLHHRARAVCSNKQLLEEEEEHLQKVLTENKYPMWALNRVKIKNKATKNQEQRRPKNTNTNTTIGSKKSYMVLPYVKGLSESMKNVGKKHGIQTYFRGGNTIKSLLMTPKDKNHITKKSGIIYRYIGKSSRTFGERYKEHLKTPSPNI